MPFEAERVVGEDEVVLLLAVSLATVGGQVDREVVGAVVHQWHGVCLCLPGMRQVCAWDRVEDVVGDAGVGAVSGSRAQLESGVDGRVGQALVVQGLLVGWEVVVTPVVEERAAGVEHALVLKLDGVEIVLGVGVGESVEDAAIVVRDRCHIMGVVIVMVELRMIVVVGRVVNVGMSLNRVRRRSWYTSSHVERSRPRGRHMRDSLSDMVDRLLGAVGRGVEQVGLLNDGVVGYVSSDGMRGVAMESVWVGAVRVRFHLMNLDVSLWGRLVYDGAVDDIMIRLSGVRETCPVVRFSIMQHITMRGLVRSFLGRQIGERQADGVDLASGVMHVVRVPVALQVSGKSDVALKWTNSRLWNVDRVGIDWGGVNCMHVLRDGVIVAMQRVGDVVGVSRVVWFRKLEVRGMN